MKRNIYMVQAGCLYGNSYYLPYAVGMLIAYASADPVISENYDFKRIIYSLEDIDTCINGMDQPFLVGFSNSIWNYKYNLAFAEKLKEKYPGCIVLFGGHHVPPTTEFLEKYEFIDLLIHRKGEEAFYSVLLALLGEKELDKIPNLSLRRDGRGIMQTPYAPTTESDYPSPYLTGVFDEIIKSNEYPFSCVLETNRGCPYNCLYCDWGDLHSKVRLFPLQKVLDELDWMAQHKMEFVYCIDANFGMFERDEQIAEKIVELKETYGYPNRLQVSYAKAEFDRVFRINKMMSDHGIGKGATLALQSLTPGVLKNIGRVNISKEEYAAMISRYRDAGISTYTELILGLPGETRETFCRGLCETLELGQHSSISAYYCELLPNSRMAQKEYIDKYGIKTVSTSLNQYHCDPMEDVLSGASTLVVGTDTMSVADWIEANLFSTCVQSFHHFGLIQCVAMYVRHEFNLSYHDFYTAFYSYARNESPLLSPIFEKVYSILKNFTEGNGGLLYQNDMFGSITYPIEEAVFLICLYRREELYAEIAGFLKKYLPGSSLPEGLLDYQKAVVLFPGQNSFEASFDFDFKSYFDNILKNEYVPLKTQKLTYRFSTPFPTEDFTEYGKEIIWFGRRNGRMLYSSRPNQITEVHEQQVK